MRLPPVEPVIGGRQFFALSVTNVAVIRLLEIVVTSLAGSHVGKMGALVVVAVFDAGMTGYARNVFGRMAVMGKMCDIGGDARHFCGIVRIFMAIAAIGAALVMTGVAGRHGGQQVVGCRGAVFGVMTGRAFGADFLDVKFMRKDQIGIRLTHAENGQRGDDQHEKEQRSDHYGVLSLPDKSHMIEEARIACLITVGQPLILYSDGQAAVEAIV